MSGSKVDFLRNELSRLCDDLESLSKGKWGKMNAQQMVEHLADFFDVSSGKLTFELVTPEEYLPKYRDFLYSDKEFRENTAAPPSIVSEQPQDIRFGSMKEALEKLNNSVKDFFSFFENNPGKKTLHPVFGWLDFDEWVLLHYKHVNHHLRQFHKR